MAISTIEIVDRLTTLVILGLGILQKVSGMSREEVLESIKKAEIRTDELIDEFISEENSDD